MSPGVWTPFVMLFYQIQPSPLAFSRSGCEAYIGDRVQGEEEQLVVSLSFYLGLLILWAKPDLCSLSAFTWKLFSLIVAFSVLHWRVWCSPFPPPPAPAHGLWPPSLTLTQVLAPCVHLQLSLFIPGQPPCSQLRLCCVGLTKPKLHCSQGDNDDKEAI